MTLPSWLEPALAFVVARPWLQAVLVVALSAVGAKLAQWLLSGVLLAVARRSRTRLDDRLIELLRRPVFVSVLLFGLWLAVGRLGFAPETETTLGRLLATCALPAWLVFAFRSAHLLLETASRWESRFEFLEPRTLTLFENLTKLVLFAGGVYSLFLIWGIDVKGILLGAGVMGIALGLAAKDTLANLFSGIFILADAPYQVGDFVNLDTGERGRVTRVGLRSTRLVTRDDIEVTVPNAVIANAKIVNESGGRWEKERIRVPVGVAYGSDVDRVRELLLEVAAVNPDLVAEPEPRVRFRAFGNSALELELLGWIEEPIHRGRVLDALHTEIYKRLQAEGVEIPYPKRDVYLKRG